MENIRLTEQDRATLQFKVTTKLRELILKGEFKMGERLMQEEWAQKLGVSRMPLREALRQLEVEGLVRIEPRRGAVVTPVSTEDIEEIYQLRALLEGEAVVKSLPFLDEETIQELETIYNKMLQLKADETDMEAYMKLNTEFHRIIREGCPWRRIQGFIETLWKGIPPYTPSLLANHLPESHKEHGLMLQYIKEKDAEKLKQVTIKHILRTKENLIQMIGNK
ncbi:GntR family transcriptional regulator [Planococcus liqunii]|uniref:GntR family transcriptional regulator n=1 Tax=Planococcus liqunii TaxID=3058394 RepID=A0ABT8MRU2_9BACL|nr:MULTISPECIES: GntR family transcriptional regulator [Planococcus]MDN7227628.1 GntR family transcriptional regulator [Planococcus sp. N064]WKA50509.1 GntR family transcriptional regulator [Planococcus sp. N056]